MREALNIVFQRQHLRKTLKIAFIVGCVLTTINQLDVFINGNATAITFVKTGLNFCVPFVVSNLGLLAGKRAERDAGAATATTTGRSESGVMWNPEAGQPPSQTERPVRFHKLIRRWLGGGARGRAPGGRSRR